MSKPAAMDQENYTIWSFVGVPLMILLSFIFPFPTYLIVSLLAIFSAYFITAERRWINSQLIKLKKSYVSYCSHELGSRMNNCTNDLSRSLIFCCINCRNQHDDVACPKCGSKAVKLEYKV